MEPFTHNDEFSNISVSENFYHNEWATPRIMYTYGYRIFMLSDQLWPNSEFSITLERSYHKYLVVMIMSFVLILTGLTVALTSVKFYRRFYILVFVPLTIIWLQVPYR